MRGLTSLFGMGRGEHPRHNHHKEFAHSSLLERLGEVNKINLHIGISCNNQSVLFSLPFPTPLERLGEAKYKK
jgi:hypothetical protein